MDAICESAPRWKIDLILEALLGADIRVAARSVSPKVGPEVDLHDLMPIRALILPDNSKSDGLLVLFEGNLKGFRRQIGVVVVCLDTPKLKDTVGDGLVPFRGKLAVAVRGPATVELDFPFLIEKLPTDSENYWRDLRLPKVQFELPLPDMNQPRFPI